MCVSVVITHVLRPYELGDFVTRQLADRTMDQAGVLESVRICATAMYSKQLRTAGRESSA